MGHVPDHAEKHSFQHARGNWNVDALHRLYAPANKLSTQDK